MSHGLSDEAVFRLQLDVIRLNKENKELRRRAGVPLDGRAVTVAVDNTVTEPVTRDGNAVTDGGNAGNALTAAEKQRRYRERQAAFKNNNATP
jgi:hypothetical protein